MLKVEDLVGGQKRSGNFAAYESPFIGSSSFVLGDALGKDVVVATEPCDHEQCLVKEFCSSVQQIRNGSGSPNPEWSKRALSTHTIMACIFESCMRDGAPVEITVEGAFKIGSEIFQDMPTQTYPTSS